MPLFEELEHGKMQFLVPNESLWGLTWLYKICHQFSDPVMGLLQDLQLHKELAFLPCLPWEQLLKHSRSGGIPGLPGAILFVTFLQVNGYFNTSADSLDGLCWSEQLLCPSVFPASFSGKGLWKLLGNTAQCLPHKASFHLRGTEFYSSCFVATTRKKMQGLSLNFRKLGFKLSVVIGVEIKFYLFMGKTDLYLYIILEGLVCFSYFACSCVNRISFS